MHGQIRARDERLEKEEGRKEVERETEYTEEQYNEKKRKTERN